MDRGDVRNSGYSADVDIWPDCGPHGRFPLAQAASTFVIAVEALQIPPCDAEIILTIGGTKRTRPVKLVNGMSATREAMILSRDSVSPF